MAAGLTEAPVLGVDLSFPMLRLAQQVLRTGYAQFALRRVGIVYDPVTVTTPFGGLENVDFWLCDALALPFANATFRTATMLNVLDCLPSPLDGLQSLSNQLQTNGQALLSTPYDWSVSATPMENWLGGHSQRSEVAGSSEAMLRTLLSGAHAQAIPTLRLEHEIEHFPWHTRLHARSAMHYDVHMCTVSKTGH